MAYIPGPNGGRINATIGGNTAGAGALVSSGTMFLAGGNNVTLSQNANSITISAPNAVVQTNQTLGLYATGANTTGQSSSNTFDARSFSISAQGGLYAGMSGNTLQLSAATTYAASNHSHGNPTLNLTNLSGTTASASNGLTLSLSANAQSNPGFSAGGGSSTFQTLSFSNANGISFTNTAGQIGASYTVPTVTNSSFTMQAGASTLSSVSRVAFGDGNGISFGASTSNNGSITITGTVATNYAASNHSHGNPTLNLTNLSGTTASASNGFTLSLSAAAPGGGGGGVALYDGANSISSGTARISAGGGLTASINGQTLSLNAPTVSSVSATGVLSVSTNGNTVSMGVPAYSAGISNGIGNTSGTTGFATNQLVLAGGNNITLSQSTAAGGNTLTISAANQTVQSQSNIQGIIASGSTNRTGDISFANSNNITFGLSNNTMTASFAGGGGGGVVLYDGAVSVTSGTVQLSAANNVTFGINGQTLTGSVPALSSLSATGGVSISTNGSTISIGAQPFPTLSRWEYPEHAFTSLPGGFSQSYLSLQHVYVPFNVVASAGKIGGSISAGTHTSASTGNITVSLMMGVYTLSGSTLSLITQSSGSASSSFAISSNVTASVNGMRQVTVPMNINMTPGEYWVGALMLTATNFVSNTLSMTMYGNSLIASANNNAILSPLGVNSTISQRDALLFQGLYSTTLNSMPTSLSGGHINNTASSAAQRAAFYHALFNATY